jgi:ABC-type sulfate transport system permease component
VVLPTASPGIFSAVMIGFGRAIGETMIVLMATGNTPIMSWSPFNGFRTLSANIAVEIPEAPVGSSLYRTLFLAALLLFAMTFVVNTLAELVRQRLRRVRAAEEPLDLDPQAPQTYRRPAHLLRRRAGLNLLLIVALLGLLAWNGGGYWQRPLVRLAPMTAASCSARFTT